MRRDTWTPSGKAPPDRPALKPYRGKPAVRNFRGDDGDVGIIRSPVRAIALPDRTLPHANPFVGGTMPVPSLFLVIPTLVSHSLV